MIRGENMKKKIIIAITIFIAILICANPFMKLVKRCILQLNTGIKVNLTVKVDGQEISLNDLEATCEYEEEKSRKVISNDGTYETKGGEYGKYIFNIVVPKDRVEGVDKDIILKLDYFNYNNWYNTVHDCTVNLTTLENRLYGKYNIHVSYNDGKEDDFSQDGVPIDENTVYISWG